MDGIPVYYSNQDFIEYVQEALKILKEEDSWHYEMVKRHVNKIVELGPNHKWTNGKSAYNYGTIIGVYFDEIAPKQRNEIPPKRYAGGLVRLATALRIIDGFKIYRAWDEKWHGYDRMQKLARKQELACCEKLACEMKYIYGLQRWIRNN